MAATYGRVWKAAIDAGVLSIMVGHISLPAYEGLENDPARAMPATLNPRLQIDLLRNELGFEGVIVSDAAPMIGITSRVPGAEEALQNILAGSDVFLFANPRQDFASLKQAFESGRLTPQRVDQSVRRVLEMKARLGLNQNVESVPLTAAELDKPPGGGAEPGGAQHHLAAPECLHAGIISAGRQSADGDVDLR